MHIDDIQPLKTEWMHTVGQEVKRLYISNVEEGINGHDSTSILERTYGYRQ